MCSQPATEQDSAIAMTPPIQPRLPWRVTAVEPLPDFRLHVHFVDGSEGIVDLASLIHSPTAGVFATLANPDRFAQAHVEHGAVTWPGGIDLAPDAMYAQLKSPLP